MSASTIDLLLVCSAGAALDLALDLASRPLDLDHAGFDLRRTWHGDVIVTNDDEIFESLTVRSAA